MPPLPAVANVLRAQLLWSDNVDANVRTTLYFRYSGGAPDATDAVALASDIYGAAALMEVLWDTATVLTGVEVTDLSVSSGAQGLHAASTAGSRSGGFLSGGTALVVSYVITRRYRGGKPRSYLPWLTASDLIERQAFEASTITSVDSALTTFFGTVIGSSSGTTTITEHVNVSYYNGFHVVTSPTTGRARNVPDRRTTPVVDTIASFGAKQQPGSQRRRNRG